MFSKINTTLEVWHLASCSHPTYFFCVSPAFTRIRRTSSTGLGGFAFQDQNDFLMFFQTEFQESASPSQLRLIFSRSPISSSVNTKKVLVRFRPMRPSWLDKGRRKQGKFSARNMRQKRWPKRMSCWTICAVVFSVRLRTSRHVFTSKIVTDFKGAFASLETCSKFLLSKLVVHQKPMWMVLQKQNNTVQTPHF